MKRFICLMICLFLLSACASLQDVEKEDDAGLPNGEQYRIGAGDVLDISVWKDEAQTKILVVLPDGTISLPLIGRITAEGKTIALLKEEITQKVSRFVPDPVVTVIVQQANSMFIYIIGRVNHPGRFVINANVNVLQALTMAGGLNSFAKRKKIRIIREEKDGETRIFTFNYNDVSAGKNLAQNIKLRRGDMVVVP
ncbi:MAG: polysaccharide biosynthesis/export family protein [Thermodesulfobacteriota bacterium]|nr:polysaccharide biosynthesis/export family protein [Thermodesulfobacteriota bacterium]